MGRSSGSVSFITIDRRRLTHTLHESVSLSLFLLLTLQKMKLLKSLVFMAMIVDRFNVLMLVFTLQYHATATGIRLNEVIVFGTFVALSVLSGILWPFTESQLTHMNMLRLQLLITSIGLLITATSNLILFSLFGLAMVATCRTTYTSMCLAPRSFDPMWYKVAARKVADPIAVLFAYSIETKSLQETQMMLITVAMMSAFVFGYTFCVTRCHPAASTAEKEDDNELLLGGGVEPTPFRYQCITIIVMTVFYVNENYLFAVLYDYFPPTTFNNVYVIMGVNLGTSILVGSLNLVMFKRYLQLGAATCLLVIGLYLRYDHLYLWSVRLVLCILSIGIQSFVTEFPFCDQLIHTDYDIGKTIQRSAISQWIAESVAIVMVLYTMERDALMALTVVNVVALVLFANK